MTLRSGPATAPEPYASSVAAPDPTAGSPFDELFAAVSALSAATTVSRVIEAPASRFMVRVAKVNKPHRATKRQYDYFEDLNTALAARMQDRADDLS
jgi:hypothetical protein